MSTATTGEVGFSDHGDLTRRQMEAAVEWGDDDMAARTGQICSAVGQRQVKTVIEEQLLESPCRSLAISSDDHTCAVGEQLANSVDVAGSVADDGAPSRTLHHWRIRMLWG